MPKLNDLYKTDREAWLKRAKANEELVFNKTSDDDTIFGKIPDDYSIFNFDDCSENCDGICDSCIDCDFFDNSISEDVIEKEIEIAKAQEKILPCCKCGEYDHWNSKGKDGKYYCYKHC